MFMNREEYPHVHRHTFVPTVIRDNDAEGGITVGSGGASLTAFLDTASPVLVVISKSVDGEPKQPNVGLMTEEAHALGRQLCKWARHHKRHDRIFRVMRALHLR